MKNNTSKTSRSFQLAKNTAIISFGTFLPKVLAVVTLPIITAGLTKVEYGSYDLICILESIFLPCVTLQIHSAAFRFLIETRENEQQTCRIVTNVMAFVCITSVVSLAFLFVCLREYSIISRILVCMFFFFDILKTTGQQIARGVNKPMLYSMSAVVNSVINVILIILLVEWLPCHLNGVVAALMFASLSAFIILAIKLRLFVLIDYRLLSKTTLKELLSFSWPMIPNSLSMWAMNLSNRVIITFFLGLEANAIFSVANKIPSLFSVVQSTFSLAWQENASITSESKDAGEYYGRMFDAVFCLMISVISVLIAVTPMMFNLLIRGDYDEAYNQMPILFIGVFFNVIVAFLGGIYVAMKATKSVGITTIVSAIINILLILLFIKMIGLFAASISMVISYMVLALYRMRDIQRFVRIKFMWSKIFICTFIIVIMCILCYQRNTCFNCINIIIAICISIKLNKYILIRVRHWIKRRCFSEK